MSLSNLSPSADAREFLLGGGIMGELIRSKDWSVTPLGPIESWPQSLRTTVSLCLASNFPINLIWGPEHIQIYNDGYRPICAGKHPKSLGEDYTKTWATAWEILDDAFQRALSGETSYLENRRMFLDRNGYLEETFFTFSLSPIRDESGEIGGLFHPVTETTLQMLSQRRTRTLQDLASRTSQAKTEKEACELAAEALADNQLDLPFVLIYLADPESKEPQLMASSHLSEESLARMERGWHFESTEVTQLTGLFGALDCGPYPESPERALILPVMIAGMEGPAGFLIAAVSPRLPFTDEYRGFIELAGATLTAAIVNAQAYEAERKRAEKLAELDRAKTAFFSNVSHEFRTPLTLMLGPLGEMLSQPGEELAVAREAVDLVNRNGLRLLRLVNTLLDFSRIEANRVQATYEPVDLASLTSDLASTFRSTIEKAGVAFAVNCPELTERIYVDREMWEKIVLNLLSNAFKFTFQGTIGVALQEKEGQAELAVSDTGTGIPARELPFIFQRFHRVQGASGRTYEGTGIGLALVADLIKLHGGTVSVESEEGRGTTFRIVIPKGFQHLPDAQVRHTTGSEREGSLGTMFVEESTRWTAGEAPVNGHAGSNARRILLADDNADMRQYIRNILAGEFEVKAAANGVEALRTIEGWMPDLVLTDVMMPELDGFGLMEELRNDKRTQGIPVIMLSARAGQESRIEGIQAGADDYLVKPFNAKELLARVRINLELSQLRHELAREEEQLRGLDEMERQWRLFDTALAHTPDSIYVFNRQGRFSYANQAFQKRWQKSFGEILGRKLTELDYPADLAAKLEGQIHQVIAEGVAVRDEASVVDIAGRRRHMDYSLVPVFSKDGAVEAVAGSTRDITDWKEATRALREANADLEQFAYAAAHDLQEPLRNVGLATQILASRYRGQLDKDADSLLQAATDGSLRMQSMVKDLLAYSRALKSGEDESAFADSDSVLSLALTNLQAAIEEKQAHISRAHLPPVRMSEVHLLQVFQNLVSNSLKYSGDKQPQVEVSATRRNGAFAFCVKDNGLGIAPEFHGRAFGIFKRLHGRDTPGTGIGLALCKRIVEHYGGKIWIESNGQEGAALLFTPPVIE